MNNLTSVYIFLLYILCSPGIIFNKNYMICALIFTCIFYFTIDMITMMKEQYTNKVVVNNEGVEDLVNNLDEQVDGVLNVKVNENISYSPEQVPAIKQLCEDKIKDLDEIKKEVTNLQKEVKDDTELKANVEKLQNTYDKLDKAVFDLQNTKNDLDNQLFNIETVLTKKDDTLFSLNNQINDLSGNLFRLETIDATRQTDIDNAITEINSQVTTANQHKDTIGTNVDIINSKKKEIDTVTHNLKLTNGEISGNVKLITKENGDITQSDKKLREKNAAIQNMYNIINRLKTNIAKNKSEDNRISGLNTNLIPVNNNLQTTETNNKNKITQLENSIKDQNKMLNQFKKCKYVPKVELVQQYSSSCCDCGTHSEYGMLNDYKMFVDKGCRGKFRSNGMEVECSSNGYKYAECDILNAPRLHVNGHHARWSYHNNYAKSIGGNMVSIHSAAENAKVNNFSKNYGNVWIGGRMHNRGFWENIIRSREGGQYMWYWSDGSSWNYANWHPGEPNRYNQDSVQMYTHGQWDDDKDHVAKPGVYQLTNNILTNNKSTVDKNSNDMRTKLNNVKKGNRCIENTC